MASSSRHSRHVHVPNAVKKLAAEWVVSIDDSKLVGLPGKAGSVICSNSNFELIMRGITSDGPPHYLLFVQGKKGAKPFGTMKKMASRVVLKTQVPVIAPAWTPEQIKKGLVTY